MLQKLPGNPMSRNFSASAQDQEKIDLLRLPCEGRQDLACRLQGPEARLLPQRITKNQRGQDSATRIAGRTACRRKRRTDAIKAEVLRQLQLRHHHLPVLILSARSDIATKLLEPDAEGNVMSDEEFNTALAKSIDAIYRASTEKV